MRAIASTQVGIKPFTSLRNVLVLAIVLRLLLPLLAIITTSGEPLFQVRDTNSYIRPAAALLSEGKFARDGEPELIRTPGYPMLLIPGIAVGHVETVTIALQIAISTATVVLVYWIAMLIFERTKIAFLAATLIAIEPISVLYSSRLLTETLFTALTALFLYLLLRYWKSGSLAYLVASAVALAASAYVRPISYYLPFVVTILLFVYMLAKDRKNTRRLLHLGVFFVICFGLIGIWQIRNNLRSGYSGFSAASVHSLYYYDAASVLAVVEDTPFLEMRQEMGYGDQEAFLRIFPDLRGADIGEKYTAMGKAGVEIILANFGTYLSLVVRGVMRTLLDPGATEFLRLFKLYPEAGGLMGLIVSDGLVTAIEFLYKEMPIVFWTNLFLAPVVPIYFMLAVFGFAKSRKAFSMPMMLFVGLAAYLLILSAATIGTSRARHPIMPMVCVLAGYGLYRIAISVKMKWLPRHPELITTI